MSKPTYFYKPIPHLPIVPGVRNWVENVDNPNFPLGALIHTSRVELICEDGKSFQTLNAVYKEHAPLERPIESGDA